jgi:hypothetical protein
MNTKDFNELAVAIVNSPEPTVPIEAAKQAVHRALTLDESLREADAANTELRDTVDNFRGTMIFAMGQIQAGNVKGAWEILNAVSQLRGHNARTEGN